MFVINGTIFEPMTDRQNQQKRHVHPVKAQTSMGINSVRSEYFDCIKCRHMLSSQEQTVKTI